MSILPSVTRRAPARATDPHPAGVPPAVNAPPAVNVLPPQARAAAAAAAVPEPCRNCGAARLGEYCARCGQHFLEDRLTFWLLAHELWERVTFERGMLRTMREMMLDPGGVVRRYTHGQRRRYVSPFTYLFLGAALSLLLLQLYEEQMAAWAHATMSAMQVDDHPFFTPAQVEAHTRAMLKVSRQTTYGGLAMGALFACFLRLFFRRSGVNLVESFVFALYTFGHVYYLSLPAIAIAVLAFDDFAITMYAPLLLYLVVCCLAGAQYFGNPIRSAVKTAAALVSSYAIFSLVVGTALFVYALLSVPEGISAPKAAAAPATQAAAALPVR